jgi:hypothetical protein
MKGHYLAAKQHQLWTPAQDARLKKMIKDGKNSEEIAIELGRTRTAIMNRKQVLGISQKITAARGSKMPYTAYDKKRRTNTGLKNSNPVEVKAESSLLETMKEKEKKTKPVEVNIDSKKIAKEAKQAAKDAVEKFKTIGKSVEKLFTNAKKNGLKVTITIGNEE